MFGESDSSDRRGAARRRVVETLRSMTRILQYVGFGPRSGPTIPRGQEGTHEVEVEEPRELHEQSHEPDAPRLERGHPKR